MNEKNMERFYDYEDFLNIIVGILAFNLALQCLGYSIDDKIFTFSKRCFYSSISFIFIHIIVFYRAYRIKKLLDQMKKVKSPYLKYLTVIIRNPIYIIGYLFLGLTVFGLFK